MKKRNEKPVTSRILTKFAWLPTIVESLHDKKDYIIWFRKYESFERYLPVNSIKLSVNYVFTHEWVVIKKYI
jgi:hypothetical protein